MKKILITGSNSFIGTSLEKWLKRYPDQYPIDSISLRSDLWKEKNFSKYDVVFHVAGIAHINETKENADIYYRVNRDLAIETAIKAKAEGVKQFIILSSMSVYGIETGVINKQTIPTPKSNYGKSKLQADEKIAGLVDDNFIVATLRPPMVYGKGCKGNYQTLAKYAVKLPFFPNIENKRSMLYIDNLSEFVRQLIDREEGGLFFPQNNEYVCTTEMVMMIAEANGRKLKLTKLFNPIFRVLKISIVNKLFGDLVYEKDAEYEGIGFDETIRITEVYDEKKTGIYIKA